jgi:hypothetical protein
VGKETEREIVQQVEHEFASLIGSLEELVRSAPAGLLNQNILRSAAVIEQTCGGLTANLWDDPFEWTLPETLSNPELIIEYLVEVDNLRRRAFDSIIDDSVLTRYISVPGGESRLLISVLLETLVRAGDFRGRAFNQECFR